MSQATQEHFLNMCASCKYVTGDAGAIFEYTGDAGAIFEYTGDAGAIFEYTGDAGAIFEYTGDAGAIFEYIGDAGSIFEYTGDAGAVFEYTGDAGAIFEYTGDAGAILEYVRVVISDADPALSVVDPERNEAFITIIDQDGAGSFTIETLQGTVTESSGMYVYSSVCMFTHLYVCLLGSYVSAVNASTIYISIIEFVVAHL